jgi:hypothetical protein
MGEDNKKFLQSLLRLHDNMAKALRYNDLDRVQKLLGIMQQGLMIALDGKVTK